MHGQAFSSVNKEWGLLTARRKESTVKKGNKRPPLASQAGFAISVTRLAAGERSKGTSELI